MSGSSSSLLKTKSTSEGSGSVESGDAITSRVQTGGKKAKPVREIPIYDADGSKISEVVLDDEVYDYLSFAMDVVAAKPGFNGLQWGCIVHVMWPWEGHIVHYRGAAEQPLNPMTERWSDFISRIRHIRVEPEMNSGVILPLHLDGILVTATQVTTDIRMRTLRTLSSFLTAIHHSFVAWWVSEIGGGRIELKEVATKNSIVPHQCQIMFFDKDGEQLPDIWSIECKTDEEEEIGDEEEEEEEEADSIPDEEGVDDAEVIDGEGEEHIEVIDDEGEDGDEEVFDGGIEEVNEVNQAVNDQVPIDFETYIGHLGSVLIKHTLE